MVHSQAPETILKDQDWPISVEAQFLAGNRTTMNVCTPGTEIEMKGAMVKAHCINSTSRLYGDDGWVAVEVEVLGSERVRHLIGGAVVLQYEHPTIGGGVATGFDPAIKKDGAVLSRRLHRPAGREPASRVPQYPPAEPRRLHEPGLAGVPARTSSTATTRGVRRAERSCMIAPACRSPAPDSVHTRSSPPSAPAAWARCIARATPA